MSNGEQFDSWGERWMRVFWRKPATTVAERTRRRVTVHLLPFLFFLYILAYLDRFNVSVAKLGMNLSPQDNGLGFTDAIIGHGAGLFFWGYWILEIPSTVSVAKWGARSVFVRILILWGICAAVCGLIGLPLMHNLFGWLPQISPDGPLHSVADFVNHLSDNVSYQFYFFRFMLGFFEGGFFPTVIVFLSYWFRQQDRAKAIACFMAAIPFSGAIGNPLSNLLLSANWFGLVGWRWVLILEGVAPILAGIATIFLLPNRPGEVGWLPDEERNWLTGELAEEARQKQGHGHWDWVHHLGMVALLTLVYFGLNVSSYGLSMFMPSIIKSQILQFIPNDKTADTWSTWIAAGYYSVAVLAMLFNGWHSDKKQERILHVSIPLAIQAVGIFLVALFDHVPILPLVILIVMVGATHYTHLPAFWPIPTMFLGAIAAASAIGFINMVGNLGGYYGPSMVGKAASEDISWLKGYLAKDDSAKTGSESDRVLKSLDSATDITAVKALLDSTTVPVEQQLSDDQRKRLSNLEANLSEGQKLSPERQLQIFKRLSAIRLRAKISQEEQEQLIAWLGQGASYASGLKRLAPWPLLSATIILLVGYSRRRKTESR